MRHVLNVVPPKFLIGLTFTAFVAACSHDAICGMIEFNAKHKRYQIVNNKMEGCSIEAQIKSCLEGGYINIGLEPDQCCDVDILNAHGQWTGNTKNHFLCQEGYLEGTGSLPTTSGDTIFSTTGETGEGQTSSSSTSEGESPSSTSTTDSDSTADLSTSDANSATEDPPICGDGLQEGEEQCDLGLCTEAQGSCYEGVCSLAPEEDCNGGILDPKQLSCTENCTLQEPEQNPVQGE